MVRQSLRSRFLKDTRTNRRDRVVIVDPRGEDLRRAVQTAGCRAEVNVVSTIEDAIRLDHKEQVGLWVINASLSDGDANKFCTGIRRQYPQAIVYVVADEYAPQYERDALVAGASFFGCKPAQPQWFEGWDSRAERRYDSARNNVAC